ncbi:restriction endonuclease [Hymenobacter sp. UYP22]|uniref:restriction endonuclease n=1 Tax=Hymenobacter sp. UYP22 TaxID=3156348 RepID=UPI00339535C1
MRSYEDLVTHLTPIEFELFVKSHLEKIGTNLTFFEAKHNQKLAGHDGTYQIDVKAVFQALGCDFLVLVECKHQSARVKREVVEVLFNRIISLGAQKGIVFSTAGFQSGAVEFATSHGIALVHVIEGRFTYQVKSAEKEEYDSLPSWIEIPKYVGDFAYINRQGFEGRSSIEIGHMDDLYSFLFNGFVE